MGGSGMPEGKEEESDMSWEILRVVGCGLLSLAGLGARSEGQRCLHKVMLDWSYICAVLCKLRAWLRPWCRAYVRRFIFKVASQVVAVKYIYFGWLAKYTFAKLPA